MSNSKNDDEKWVAMGVVHECRIDHNLSFDVIGFVEECFVNICVFVWTVKNGFFTVTLFL